MDATALAHHTAKHLLAHVLATAAARRWPGAARGDSGETPTGFFADLALPGALGDADLEQLTDDMAALLRSGGAFHPTTLGHAEARAHFAAHPWKAHQVEVLSETEAKIECFELGGVLDLCDCRLKRPQALQALHPETFLLSGSTLVAWQHRGRQTWFVRIQGELFPPAPPCACC